LPPRLPTFPYTTLFRSLRFAPSLESHAHEAGTPQAHSKPRSVPRGQKRNRRISKAGSFPFVHRQIERAFAHKGNPTRARASAEPCAAPLGPVHGALYKTSRCSSSFHHAGNESPN